MKKKTKQERLKEIYGFIQENLYLCLPDMKVGGLEVNTTLMFELLSSLNHGKQMLMGEYGLGKTTSSENIISLLYGLPKEAVLAAELRGHPEQTEEKMIARPDLGELNKGNEKVLWSYFVLNAPKILDEFNRLPASKQNMVLDGIDRGNWKYLSELVQSDEFTLFATCNYEDKGNGALIEPILDRFDIATESKRPGLIQLSMIKDIPCKIKKILNDPETADAILKVYEAKDLSHQEKLEQVLEISEEFKEKLSERTGLELLTRDELAEAKKEIKKTEFSNEADLFYMFILAELTSCQQYGMKRASQPCVNGCHFNNYACAKVENGISVRTTQALANYAQALAWFTEEKKVSVEHLEKILPYAIWHKMKFTDAFLGQFREEQRTEPLALYAAKQLTEEIKKRFVEQMPMISNYVVLMREGKVEEAQKYAQDKEHPIFREFERNTWVK